MADHPDPTRRLRPLQESRARRRALLDAEVDRSSSDAGTAGVTSPVPSLAPSLPQIADGWVPSFTPDPADSAVGRVLTDRVAAEPRWTDPADWPEDDAGDEDVRAGRRHRHRGLPGSAGGTTIGAHRRRPLARHAGGVVEDDRDLDGESTDGSELDDGSEFDNGSEFDVDSDRDGDDGGRRDRSPWAGLVRGGRRPWVRWRERWVPDGVGPRVDPGRRGSALISLVAVAAVLAAAFGALPGRGTVVGPSTVAVVDTSAPTLADASSGADVPVPGTPGTPPAGATQPADGGAGSTEVSSSPGPGPTTAPTDIVVAVTGGVRQPGVVTLVPGSRVADAIAAAGGIVDGTDYTGLNLAAKLADGDSIVVGGAGQGVRSGSGVGNGVGGAATTAPGETSTGPVDLNAADQATLETLPGVGPVMAGNIIDWRTANGGFTTVDELQEITGIGPARFATLAPLVRVG